jgi:glutaredoxin 3
MCFLTYLCVPHFRLFRDIVSATKNTIAGLGLPAKIFELDTMNDGADIQAALQKMTGQRTVPNVFINGEWLGGNDSTQAAVRSGKLQQMLDTTKK